MTKKIAIVGSRDFPYLSPIVDLIKALPEPIHLISGGARGVDRVAEKTIDGLGWEKTIFKPDYANLPGWKAPLERNTTIAEECEAMVAFWSEGSDGTRDVIDKALRFGKPVHVVFPEDVEAEDYPYVIRNIVDQLYREVSDDCIRPAE